MQTAGNHSAVHVDDEKGELPVVTLTLFRRMMHNSPVTVVRRCKHCAAPAFSRLEWGTFSCFLMCRTLRALRT